MVVGQGWRRGRVFPTLVHSLRHGPLCKAVAGSTGQALAGLGCRAAKIGRWVPRRVCDTEINTTDCQTGDSLTGPSAARVRPPALQQAQAFPMLLQRIQPACPRLQQAVVG